MPLLPHCQLQQPTNGFVDLRKPTSNSGNNLLITDFQVQKNQTFTINYKVVQSGMEANKSAIVTIENQFNLYLKLLIHEKICF
jgi:hypothetical protein